MYTCKGNEQVEEAVKENKNKNTTTRPDVNITGSE